MKKRILSIILLSYTVLSLIACGNNKTSDIKNNTENNEKHTEYETKNINFDYTMVIDGLEINLPVEYSVLEDSGFTTMDSDFDLNESLESYSFSKGTYNSNSGSLYGLFTNGRTSNIEFIFYNNSDEAKALRDCYVVKIGFEISQRTINAFSLGEVKIINNTNEAEAVIGTSLYEDVQNDFGLHYRYDYSNTLSFYPDDKEDGVIDMDDTDGRYALHMYFDNDTKVLDAYDFYYCNAGNFAETK